jgi:hypothetical protein
VYQSKVQTKAGSQLAGPYWSGFQLNNMMHSLVVVCVEAQWRLAQNNTTRPTQFAKQQLIKVFYETVFINEGNIWNASNSCFTARHSGIYVFSVMLFINLKLFSKGSSNLQVICPSQTVH